VISSIGEFDDATSLERQLLEKLVPLPKRQPYVAIADIAEEVDICIPQTLTILTLVGGERLEALDLRAFGFGAAWKILDLLMELAFNQAGPARPHWRIADKVKLAKAGAGNCPPLTVHATVWSTIAATYASFEELRHALVHRMVTVDGASSLIGTDRNGASLRPVTYSEYLAACRIAQRASSATISQQLTRRELSDLKGQLDQLSAHHLNASFGGRRWNASPALVIAPPGLQLDVPGLITKVCAKFPGISQFDVKLELPDGRQLIGDLETLEPQIYQIDPADLPPGLKVDEP
jgi:hypothetical protein